MGIESKLGDEGAVHASELLGLGDEGALHELELLGFSELAELDGVKTLNRSKLNGEKRLYDRYKLKIPTDLLPYSGLFFYILRSLDHVRDGQNAPLGKVRRFMNLVPRTIGLLAWNGAISYFIFLK